MQMIKMPVRIASVALMSLASWKFAAAGTVPQGWQQGPSDAWFVNWDDAVAEAKKTQKPIFVLKTGSDWCGWCIRLRKNVLSKPEFEAFAAKNLVLLYLDSPSKSPLCDEQKSHNQQVSRQLHLGGGVPNASVVTTDGKKLGTISGGALGLEDYLKRLEDIVENTTGGEIREPTSSLRDVKASYKSETVGGLSWRYRVSGGKAIVEAPIERGRWRGPAAGKSLSGCVRVPDSLGGFPVGGIGKQAFCCCKDVTKVVVPSAVTSIDDEAFDGCDSLAEVSLPDSVLSIGDRAFYCCSNLVSVTVPCSLTSIGWDAFSWCRRLAAFAIPTACVSIGDSAFAHCEALTEMRVPAGVRKIGNGAFSYCAGLRSFSVDAQNQMYRHIGSGLYNEDGTSLLGYPCPGGVARISADVTNISETARIDLGFVRSIEVDSENPAFKSVGGCLYDRDMTSIVGCPNVFQMEIPMGVRRIEAHACKGLKNSERILIPEGVVDIGDMAFAYGKMKSVSLPSSLTNIGVAAFYSCKSLESITIPSSVKSVGGKAFAYCWHLKEVTIKPGLESIGWQAFIGCPRLSCVRLPSSVREIGKNDKVAGGMPPYSAFEPMYPKNASSLGMPPLCDELTFVVDKGDKERVRGMFFDKRFEKRQELMKKRGLPDRAIKVMPEDEYRRLKD